MIGTAVLFERFIGRREELQFLIETRTRSAREGVARTVFVAGEAGIGKTRLLSEFERAVTGERGAFALARGELSAMRPFGALIAIFRQLGGQRLLRNRPAIARAIEVLTSEGAVDGRDASAARNARFIAVRDALDDCAQRLGQLTLVVDDAQWVDFGSLEALGFVFTDTRRSPIMLVVAYRSEDLESDLNRATALTALQRAGADRIALSPLQEREVATPLRSLLPNASAAMLKRVYDLSEGKPYVIEELARNLTSAGARDVVAPTLSLKSAVLARVSTLDATARSILERAAVHGRVVRYEDLFALGEAPADVFRAIRAARELQLVDETGDSVQAAFRFRHSLTHEILYRELLVPERQAMHGTIAEHLKTAGDGRIAEYAYHLEAAGERAASVPAFEHAGDLAYALAAFGDAAAAFARGATASDAPHDLFRIAMKYVSVFGASGKVDGVLEAVETWRARLRAAGQPHDAFDLGQTTLRHLSTFRSPSAVAYARTISAELPADATPKMLFDFEHGNFAALVIEHRFAEAAEAAARAEWAWHPRPPKAHSILLSMQHILVHFWHGNKLLARQIAAANLNLSRFTGDEPNIAKGVYNLAINAMDRGEYSEALRLFREARGRFAAAGITGIVRRTDAMIAQLSAQAADFETARMLLAAADRDELLIHDWVLVLRSFARAFGDYEDELATAHEASLKSGDYLVASACGIHLAWMAPDRESARRALAALPPEPEGGALAFGLAEAIITFGTDDEARAAIERFRVVPDEADDDLTIAHAQFIEALYAKRMNRTIAAREAGKTAAALFRKMGVWRLYASALDLAGDREAARDYLQSIGAVRELKRYESTASDAARPGEHDEARSLTQREEQVARLAASGLAGQAIGEHLRIGRRTVETHIANIYEKLGITSRSDLASYFARGTDVEERSTPNPAKTSASPSSER